VADTIYLSPDAHARLTAEHEELTTVWRTDIARKIQVAREMGDLKENGDYHAAKEEQGKKESRIRTVAATLENAEIVETVDTSVAGPLTVVTVDFGDGDHETYLIGSIEEKPDGVEVLTPVSPLGAALLGQAVGTEVKYEANGNIHTVTIVEITANG
jgi:transcription elongation factor GreA